MGDMWGAYKNGTHGVRAMSKGSILIEFLISFFLSLLLGLWLATFIVTWYFHVDQLAQSCCRSLVTYQSLSCLIRDFSAAPHNPEDWKKQEPDYVVWQGENCDYGYELSGKRLVRYEGLFGGGHWKKRAASTVLLAVDAFKVSVVTSHEGIEGVVIVFLVHGKRYEFFTRCLGGVRIVKEVV